MVGRLVFGPSGHSRPPSLHLGDSERSFAQPKMYAANDCDELK